MAKRETIAGGPFVTFEGLPRAVAAVLEKLERVEAELAALRAERAAAPPPAGGDGGLMAFSQACAHLGVSRGTLSRWKRQGTVPFLRVGTKTYFRAADLESYNRCGARPPGGLRRLRGGLGKQG